MGSVARPETFPARQHPSERPWPSPRTRPEDVFLLWLLQLPEGTDVAEAARKEIIRMDRNPPLSPKAARLRELMAEATESGASQAPRRR